MAYSITFGKLALDDVRSAADWYKGESLAALERFLDAIDARLPDLVDRPLSFSSVRLRPVYRRARLRRFPYLLIFRVDEARNRVFVAALIHEKRNPGIWVRQLR